MDSGRLSRKPSQEDNSKARETTDESFMINFLILIRNYNVTLTPNEYVLDKG